MGKYDDIINLPHHVSKNTPRCLLQTGQLSLLHLQL